MSAMYTVHSVVNNLIECKRNNKKKERNTDKKEKQTNFGSIDHELKKCA